jgi:hypothetical protein
VQVLNGTVNGSTAWVVAGEDLTPGTEDIDWAPYAWQGAQPGGAGSGGSIGINVKSSPYLAVGDGVADDTAAIQSAIDAAPLGGIVWFPVGTYLITGRLSVPAGVTLVGETRRSRHRPGRRWSGAAGPAIPVAGCEPLFHQVEQHQ